MNEQLSSIRSIVVATDWTMLINLVSSDRSMKLFSKYKDTNAFHNAFMSNDQVANRAIQILDGHTAPFIKAIKECNLSRMEEIESASALARLARDSAAILITNYNETVALMKPVLSLVTSLSDIIKMRWAFMRFIPSISTMENCFVWCNSHLLNVNKSLQTTMQSLEIRSKSNSKRAEVAEQTVDQLSSRLEQHEQSVTQAVRAALLKHNSEFESLKTKLKEKERKIEELERTKARTPDFRELRILLNSLQETTQIGLLASEEEQQNTTPDDIYRDLIEVSSGLKLLVVGGARQQLNHFSKLDELCAKMGMTYVWELAEYDNVGQAQQWITNNVPKYDIVIFLHWNRTEVHKHGLKIARRHKVVHGSCYYAGFLSLQQLLVDMIVNYSNSFRAKSNV